MIAAFLTRFAADCSGDANAGLQCLPHATADSSAVQTLLTVVISVIAVVCVLFVAIGGLRYVLSQGDPNGVSKAKGTIMYALIGLAVAVLADFIVIFVLNKVV